jgi:uncharacterized protein (TIGR00369 family)
LVDVTGGGLAARAAAPDWIATADLDVHVAETEDRGEAAVVEAHGRVARAGRTTVVVEVTLRPGGTATMTFAVLPRRAGNPDLEAVGATPGRRSLLPAGPGFAEPFASAVGIEAVDPSAGRLSVPVIPYTQNTLGALQGGVVAAVAEAAAASAVAARLGRPTRTVDLHIAYLALGRNGPVVTTTDVLGAAGGRGVARVEVVDTGNEGRLMAVALAEVSAR